MADFIRSHGGEVAGAFALTGKQYSAKLSLSDETLSQLRERLGDLEGVFREATGYGYDFLTESEARALVKFKPVERVRDRILAQRDARSQRMDEEATGEAEGGLSLQTSSAPAQAPAPRDAHKGR